jgi:hypothetical protein
LAAQSDSVATRELLSKHYFNCACLLRETGQFAEALELILARRDLWAGDAERLISVARELSEMHLRLVTAGDGASELRAEVLDAGMSTMRDAAAAGLSEQRLKDPALAAFYEGLHDDAPPTT